MEQDNKPELEQNKQLMLDSLSLNTLGDTEEPSEEYPIPKGSIINEELKPEAFVLELCDGFKLQLSSLTFDVLQLSNIALQLYEKLRPTKQNGEGGYIS